MKARKESKSTQLKGTKNPLFALLCALGVVAVLAAPTQVAGQNFAGTPLVNQLEAEDDTLVSEEDLLLSNMAAEVQAVIEAGDSATIGAFEGSSTYTLGNTDVIDVSVLRHPEVSGQFVINNEGNIQYEFVGDIQIAGLTKDETKELLEEKLSTYIVAPEVTVKIIGYNSKVVYVVGEVGRPGKISMHGDTITVREALLQAGLPLLTAANRKTTLFTPSDKGTVAKQKVDLQKLLYEGDLRENHVMNPGDTLYVPPTFLAKTMRVINPVAQPIGTAAGTGRTVMTGF